MRNHTRNLPLRVVHGSVLTDCMWLQVQQAGGGAFRRDAAAAEHRDCAGGLPAGAVL